MPVAVWTGGRLARGRTRGGEGIQTLRAKRAAEPSAGALLLLGAVGAYSALRPTCFGCRSRSAGPSRVVALAIGLVGRWARWSSSRSRSRRGVRGLAARPRRGRRGRAVRRSGAARCRRARLRRSSRRRAARGRSPSAWSRPRPASPRCCSASRVSGGGRGARSRDRRARRRGRARERLAWRWLRGWRLKLRGERASSVSWMPKCRSRPGDLERAPRLDRGRGEQEAAVVRELRPGLDQDAERRRVDELHAKVDDELARAAARTPRSGPCGPRGRCRGRARPPA